jgi:hypothetical protein
MSHQMNGRTPSGPSELITVLLSHAQTLGRIESNLVAMDRRLTKLETGSMMGLSPIQFIQIGIGVAVMGAAVTGRISWGEGLPLIGKLFGAS